MLFDTPLPEPGPLRRRIEEAHRADEEAVVAALLDEAAFEADARSRVQARARALVETVRSRRRMAGGIDVFLQEYDLSTAEGVTLMCLAESLLRVPDADTADKLIRDKIGGASWDDHLGQSSSAFVNASTWALMLTGRIIELDEADTHDAGGFLKRLVARSGEPVIRQAMRHAMHIMGRQFVMGETIEDALQRSGDEEFADYRFSYDMLGEAARTAADAARYFDAYMTAVAAIGASGVQSPDPRWAPGMSVKLSALHPRFETAQRDRVLSELTPRLLDIARAAREAGIGLTVDAEEADRLDLSLDVIEAAATAPDLAGWDGLGLAVQAYQKRALPVIHWLGDLARRTDRRLMVRLVKGAYWDSEIKRTQEGGFADYPVFTRKAGTDLSYIACARKLLAEPALFYPQFATHNAHTLAAVEELAGDREFEFQRLHGMGQPLYSQIVGGDRPCRIYAPVGGHVELLAYLVRRLLENGANTSFVNRLADDAAPVDDIIADPAEVLAVTRPRRHPQIALPKDMYGDWRNSMGDDLNDPAALRRLSSALSSVSVSDARPVIGGEPEAGEASRSVLDPADRRRVVGQVSEATEAQVERAVGLAVDSAEAWERTPAAARAAILERAADLLEERRVELFALAIREAGKTLNDAVAEVREAADFCRYYAHQARRRFGAPEVLPGPTGEDNRLALRGRGVVACISPWNFPLAIFTGQVAAALAAGNAVIAKPAEQTPLMAAAAVRCLLEAGVPPGAFHLLPGDGAKLGPLLVEDPRVGGVVFTGSLATAQTINRGLAARPGAIVPLIAETGGVNAMIVDSTALPEQVVDDVVVSAFRSAGQRCSALRVLFLQEDVADHMLEMLAGRAAELSVGDPSRLATDVGPVIDEDARDRLEAHAVRMDEKARLLFRAELPDDTSNGLFVAPRIYEIGGLDDLPDEVFGPILHVVRYEADHLDDVVAAINGAGYGLTLGIHSRVDATVRDLVARLRVGNIYVNRSMIGSVVGVQPFGGEGLSGTGPKAGGPNYLTRLAAERSLTVNTAAAGGNVALLSGLGGEKGG